MFWRFCAILFAGALLEWQLTQCAPADVGKSKEKVRAYEFGYSIEENQHRHEKRDENGIVMGEFGFITADGIYHVTVYATDENGKFKILAMKNYPYRSPEKKIMIAMLPPLKKPVVVPTTRKAIPLNNQSCGGCVLTKKFTGDAADVAEQIPANPEGAFRPLSKAFKDVPITTKNVPLPGGANPKGTSLASRPKLPSVSLLPSIPLKPNAFETTASKISEGNGKKYPLTNIHSPTQPLTQVPVSRQGKAFTANSPPQVASRFGSANGGSFSPTSQLPGFTSNTFPNAALLPAYNKNLPTQGQLPTLTPNTATLNTKEPKSFQPLNQFLQNGAAPFKSAPPSLSRAAPIQNTIQSLTKNTLSQQTGRVPSLATVTPQFNNNNALTQPKLTNNLTPTGMQIGSLNDARTPTSNLPSTKKLAPSSPSIGKITPSNNGGGPLYRFNYVLDYNSHREEGRIDGSKEGNYNTIDEDGIRRIIDYIANENGYQPHIKWERVPPNEQPTGDNKLKEYEFVWFNTP